MIKVFCTSLISNNRLGGVECDFTNKVQMGMALSEYREGPHGAHEWLHGSQTGQHGTHEGHHGTTPS